MPSRDADAPSGTPRFGWFAGVLEGRVGDRDALRRATLGVAATRTAPPDLELEGGRFSLLFDETAIPGERLTVADQEALLEALQKVMEASGSPGTVESTLRGSLVYDEAVVESLFTARGGVLEVVSRRRGLSSADRRRAPGMDASEGESEGASRLRGVSLLVLIAAACGLLAFYGGYVDRARGALFGASAESIQIQTDAFAGSLDVSLARKLGQYIVTVRRGPDYPDTADAVEARIAAAETPAERAAASAIANGGDVWLRLENADGDVLHAREISLGALLSAADRTVEQALPSKLGTSRLRVSLDAGKRP